MPRPKPLLRGLDRARYEPVVAVPDRGPLCSALEGACHVELVPMERLERFSDPLRALRYGLNGCRVVVRLVRLVRRERIDLLHANGTSSHAYGGITGRLCRVPALWHVRDAVRLGRPGRLLCAPRRSGGRIRPG